MIPEAALEKEQVYLDFCLMSLMAPYKSYNQRAFVGRRSLSCIIHRLVFLGKLIPLFSFNTVSGMRRYCLLSMKTWELKPCLVPFSLLLGGFQRTGLLVEVMWPSAGFPVSGCPVGLPVANYGTFFSFNSDDYLIWSVSQCLGFFLYPFQSQ